MAPLIRETLAVAFLVLGALFMLVASIGILRMPDLFMRMQAATKAAALGAGLMFLAALLYFWLPPVTLRVIAAIVFIFLTLPIAAHLLSRAAYLTGIQIWQDTKTGMPDPYQEEPRPIDVDENAEGAHDRSGTKRAD